MSTRDTLSFKYHVLIFNNIYIYIYLYRELELEKSKAVESKRRYKDEAKRFKSELSQLRSSSSNAIVMKTFTSPENLRYIPPDRRPTRRHSAYADNTATPDGNSSNNSVVVVVS